MNVPAALPEVKRSRRSRRNASQWNRRAEPWWLALLVAGSVLAFGAQHFAVLFALAAAATVLAWLAAERGARVPLLGKTLAALCAFTLLQLLPLPERLLAFLSPASAEIWTRCLKPLAERAPSFAPITVDPRATSGEVLRWWTYLCVFLAARGLRREHGTELVARIVFGSGVLLALVTLLHGALGLERVYGFYQPSFTTERWQRGPLLNTNNLAAYLNLAIGAGIGLSISSRVTLHRALPVVGSLIMAASVVLSGSRGGMLCLVLMAVAAVAGVASGEGFSRRFRTTVLGACGLLLGALALGMALAGSSLLGAWFGQDISRKLAAWRWSLPMLRDFPWFGIGRGAYETAFPAYRGYLGYDWTSVFSHPENIVLQWLVEWGLPVGLSALLVLGSCLVKALGSARRDRLLLGLWIGVVAVLLQNLVDLSSEVPGVMLTLVVALAALSERGATAPPVDKTSPPRKSLVLLAGVGVLTLTAGSAGSAGASAREERSELASRYKKLDLADSSQRREFRSRLRAAMLRHPAEPFFPLLGGLVALRAHDENPLPWLSRALERGPTMGTVHLALADALHARPSSSQALLHLRLASQYDATLRVAATLRAASWARDLGELERALPEGVTGDEELSRACTRWPPLRALACWRRVSERTPGNLWAYERRSELIAAALGSHEEPCGAERANGCRAELDEIASQVRQRKLESWRVAAARAAGIVERSAQVEAIVGVLDHCPSGSEGAPCVRRVVELSRALHETSLVDRSLERYLALACADGADCAEAHDIAADAYAELGGQAVSLRHRMDAARASPTAARWLRAAKAALDARSLPSALVAIQRAESFSAMTEVERAEVAALRTRLAEMRPALGE